MEILVASEYIEETSWYHNFTNARGEVVFSFPCDEKGRIDTVHMHPEARENLRLCLNGYSPHHGHLYADGVEEHTHSFWTPAEGACDRCTATVVLEDPMTNTCEKCGAEYNGCGYKLDPNWRNFAHEDGEYDPGTMEKVGDIR